MFFSGAASYAVSCPSGIFGNYNYTLDTTKCTGDSSLAICPSRTNIAIDLAKCTDKIGYSSKYRESVTRSFEHQRFHVSDWRTRHDPLTPLPPVKSLKFHI